MEYDEGSWRDVSNGVANDDFRGEWARGLGAKEHQVEALKAFWAQHTPSRFTFHMACGTGKTFVGVLAAAAQQAERNANEVPFRVLVLVPSILLVHQIKAEWCKRHPREAELRFLCVCSGGATDDVPITRSAEEVSKFLSVPDANAVVISTYHSVDILREAQHTAPGFDFAIFDEAHRTAGSGGHRAQALDDGNLRCAQRLFFTATPRLSEMGNFVVSMDNEALYGEVWHRLPFSRARSLELVVPYRLEILILDSFSDNGEDEDGASLIERALDERRQLLAKAVQEHVLQFGKAVVYSSTNKRANEFAEELRTVGSAPVYTVSGGRSNERDLAMKALREEERCIISNCRCLQEGVDVPALELAVVADPKSSVIDIVQLAGRVMRIAPGKTCGTILAPIVKVAGSDKLYGTKGFDIALKVLDALQDHDEGLRAALQAARERYGYNGTLTAEEVENALGEYVVVREAGEMTSASALCRQHVLTAAIRLSGNGSWDERFGELLAYRQSHGNCSVPQRYNPNPALGAWVSNVRQNRRASKLTAERERRLETAGFVWDTDDTNWERRFEELLAFKEAQGHCNVPQGYKPNPALGEWVSTIRKSHKTGKLAADRKRRLEHAGFVWDSLENEWDRRFEELLVFKEAHGHCDVPNKYKPNPSLGTWVANMRTSHKAGKLAADRERRLEQAGFLWDTLENEWERRFEELLAFKEAQGHCNVPRAYKPNPALGMWVGDTRKNRKAGKLTAERERRLEHAGFVWDSLENEWERRFEELRAFKEAQGHCSVPQGYKPNPALGTWVNNMRQAHKTGKLTADRKRQLEKTGLIWDSQESEWERRFEELLAFKEARGHCNVPNRFNPNPALGKWVDNMRTRHKAGKLAADRERRLEKAGFVWCPRRDGGSSSLQCPGVASSSPRRVCDAAVYPSTDDIEVINLNALD